MRIMLQGDARIIAGHPGPVMALFRLVAVLAFSMSFRKAGSRRRIVILVSVSALRG